MSTELDKRLHAAMLLLEQQIAIPGNDDVPMLHIEKALIDALIATRAELAETRRIVRAIAGTTTIEVPHTLTFRSIDGKRARAVTSDEMEIVADVRRVLVKMLASVDGRHVGTITSPKWNRFDFAEHEFAVRHQMIDAPDAELRAAMMKHNIMTCADCAPRFTKATNDPQPIVISYGSERVAESNPSVCKVCGSVPDETGERVHGKGCYVMNEEGGGSDWPDIHRSPHEGTPQPHPPGCTCSTCDIPF